MPDQLAYERDLPDDLREVWRVEVELKTGHGPLPKVFYVPERVEAEAIGKYAIEQGGRVVSMLRLNVIERYFRA